MAGVTKIKYRREVSILRHAVAVGEGLSRLGLLAGGPPLSLFDMLLATTGGEVGFENLMSRCGLLS